MLDRDLPSSAVQTAAQRVYFLHQAKAANPELVRRASPHSHRLYGRYLAGEITWEEVCQQLDSPFAAGHAAGDKAVN
jgi:hypothetical protein